MFPLLLASGIRASDDKAFGGKPILINKRWHVNLNRLQDAVAHGANPNATYVEAGVIVTPLRALLRALGESSRSLAQECAKPEKRRRKLTMEMRTKLFRQHVTCVDALLDCGASAADALIGDAPDAPLESTIGILVGAGPAADSVGPTEPWHKQELRRLAQRLQVCGASLVATMPIAVDVEPSALRLQLLAGTIAQKHIDLALWLIAAGAPDAGALDGAEGLDHDERALILAALMERRIASRGHGVASATAAPPNERRRLL